MPLPKPQSNESEGEFVSRCMSEAADEFPDASQRYAVCQGIWDEHEGKTRPAHEAKARLASPETVEDRLNALMDEEQPRLIRWAGDLWQDQAADITDLEVRAAIAAGQLPENWPDNFRASYIDWVNARLVPAWEAASGIGFGTVRDGALRLGITHDWSFLQSRIGQFILGRATQLPAGFSERQMEALRAIFRYHITVEPLAHRTLANVIRAAVGLTPRQAEALRLFRSSLVEEGLSVPAIAAQVATRSLQMRTVRAENIARTELAIAHNFAARASVDDIAAAGGFPGPVTRVWRTQADERVCPICGPLDETTATMSGVYPSGHDGPPAHPSCRCVEIFDVDI